jgi:hypothetical protein
MSLTKVTNSMISGASANVLDFGAVGNNIADDVTAINLAIASVSVLGGDVLLPIPSVAYKVSTTIILPPGVRLIGQGATLRWRNVKTPVKINYTGGDVCIKVVALANTVMDAGQIINIHIDGTNATANTDGLLLDASASSSAIEGFYSFGLTITNFPRYQVHHTGEVFDTTYNRLAALNPDVPADSCVFIEGNVPSQNTFIDCWIAPYTAGKWGVYQNAGAQDIRFFGGTIAPYSAPNSANGIYAEGGLYIYGTHIEGIGSDINSIGVSYIGSTAAYIAPSQCSGFGTNVRIGDSSSSVARGWVVNGNVGGHISGGNDVWITSGATREGTILDIGHAGGLGVIKDDRQTSDGVYDVNNFYTGPVYATKGPVFLTPDGTKHYQISIDNAGAVITTLI